MNFKFTSICDQGAFRSNNEDAIKFGCAKLFKGSHEQFAWMIIADGMGGHQAGEVASKIIVDEVENQVSLIENCSLIDPLCWIEITLNKANHKIYSQAQKNKLQNGMGSTAVLAMIIQNQCYVGWVGDSRCYLYSTSKDSKKTENHESNKSNTIEELTQLTTDHTMVQLLLDKGAITSKEAEVSNNKNMLSRAMGVKSSIKIDTKQHPIHNNELLLLSTDGLHDSLTHQSLTNFVTQIRDGKDISDLMVQQAIKCDSRDNITFGSIFIK